MLRKISRKFACGIFIGLVLLIEVPLLSAQTSTWTGGAGNWAPCPPTGNARWNTCPTYPDTSGFSAVISGGPVTLASGNGISVANLTVNAGDSVIVTPGYLYVFGTSIANNGTISIGPGNGMDLQGGTTLTLSGTGSVTLTDPMATFWALNGISTFTNQQTIQGEGRFSLGMNLINQGTINANSGTLSLQPNSATNTATMEASSGSILQFANGLQTAYNNAGGTIQALNGGTVQFQNGIYTGGILTTTGTGVILAENSAILNGLTTSGALQVPTGNQASLKNTITNTGTISVPSSTLSMTGAVTLKGTGNLLMSGSGNLNRLNGPGDTLTSQQMLHGAGTIYQVPLTNQGTVAADSNGNTLTLAGNTTTNTSLLEAINGGILTIQSDATVVNTGGMIQAQNNSTVNLGGKVSGGTLTTSGTGTIQSQNGTLDGTTNIPTNTGLLDVNGFDLFFQGTIKNNGTISLTGNSCVILNQPSTLTGTGTLRMASTTCIFGSGLRFTNSSNVVGAGTVGDSNPMPITNNGNIQANNTTNALIINSGTYGFTNNGKLIVNASSTLNVQGLFNNLSNNGTFTGGTYLVTGTLGVQNSIVTNAANITLTGAAAKISNTNMGTNALATLTTIAATGVLSLQSGQVLMTAGNLSTAGIISVGIASSFRIGGSYTQTAGKITVDGTLTAPTGLLLQNGTLQGQGTIAAAMTSDATVVAGDTTLRAGKLMVNGSYSEAGTGALDIAIGGHTVGTQYSQLAVSNGAHLNGTLNIRLINNFVPSIGSVFTILTANPVTGTFGTVNGLHINSGEHFDIAYTSSAVTLTVASGP
jgi:hypothetical protein